jgi:RNA-directed DNA polymerase
VFNDKPNYGRAEYLRLRAITHNCATQGFESQLSKSKQLTADAMIDWLRGNINWVTQINPDRGHKLLEEFNVALAIHENKNVK